MSEPSTDGQGTKSDSLRILLPPQDVRADRYVAWHTGLVASATFVTCALMIEFPADDSDEEVKFSGIVPTESEMWITTVGGRRIKALWWGGENLNRGILRVQRIARWDPLELPSECGLQILMEKFGIDYSATFGID